MRTSVALALAVALFAPSAFAQSKGITGSGAYGDAGCGLGSIVFGNQPGIIQVVAATLNATGVQTFGITTGTSNCQPGLFAQGTKSFVEGNREMVAKDISRGQGEGIGALTQINACSDSTKVGAALQKNFAAIFPSESVSSDDVTAKILETLHGDPALGCGGRG